MAKKKILLSAIVVICLCVSLICGTTFALFTSESDVNISVTSGKVSVAATIGDPETAVLENSGLTTPNVTAKKDGNTVILDKMTPGDVVSFKIHVKNNSTVAVKYRTTVACKKGEILMSGLNFTVGERDFSGVLSYASKWNDLAIDAEFDVDVTVALPIRGEADDFYQGLTTEIAYAVEAVQANGAQESEEELQKIVVVRNTEEAQAAMDDLTENTTVLLTEGTYGKLSIRPSHRSVYHEGGYDKWPQDHACYDRFINNVSIIGEQGAEVVVNGITTGSTLYNVEGFPSADKPVEDDKPGTFSRAGYFIDGITFDNLIFSDGISFIEGGWAPIEISNITVNNCMTVNDKDRSENVDVNKLINSRAKMENVVISNCQVANRFQGVYLQSAKNVTVTGCKFTNTVHNAIAVQSGCSGEIVLTDNIISDCHDRAIRFGDLGVSNISVKNNVMVNSGDEGGELMKAVSLAEGTEVVIANNYWCGKTDLTGVIVNVGGATDGTPVTDATVDTYDFTDAKQAAVFCPDCFNKKGPHAEHKPYLDIDTEKGVANVKRNGAWLNYSVKAGSTYVISYDVDLTALTEGSFVAFDCGETFAWNDLQLGFVKDGGTYKAYNTLFEKQLASKEPKILSGAKVHVECTFVIKPDGADMSMTLNGKSFVSKTVTPANWADASIGICWNVYTYSANGSEANLCALSNMKVTVNK